MCSHYQALKERDRYIRHFGVEPPQDQDKFDVWPGYSASFIRRHPHAALVDRHPAATLKITRNIARELSYRVRSDGLEFVKLMDGKLLLRCSKIMALCGIYFG